MGTYKTYMEMSEEEDIVLSLTQKEEAAMFAAYDYGISNIDKSSRKLVQNIIDKIKDEVWPDE